MSNWLKGYSPKQIKEACQEFAHYLGLAAASGWVAADRLLRGAPFATDEAKWITVHPNGKGYNNSGEKIKGTPVLIDEESGEVLGGVGGKFTGKHISEMPKRGANAVSAQHDIERVRMKREDQEGFAQRQKELIAKRDQQLKQAQEEAAKAKAEAERKAKEAQEQQAKEQAAAQQRANAARAQTTRRRKTSGSAPNDGQILAKYGAPDYKSISQGFDIAKVRENTAISLYKPFKEAEEPFYYGYWQKEQEENRALTDPNWKPAIKFDLVDDAALQANYNQLARDTYAYRAMRRIAGTRGQALTPEQHKQGEQLEADYQKALNQISQRRAKQTASTLANLGQQIGNDALKRTRKYADYIGRRILENSDAQDTPASLLSLMGYKSRHLNPYKGFAKYDDSKLYFKAPANAEALAKAAGRSDSKPFNNLFNAKFLLQAAVYAPNLSSEAREQLKQACQEAEALYRESHDNLPLTSCFNRDMALVMQKSYGNASLAPKAVGKEGAEQGDAMSWQAADELRGNENYGTGQITTGLGDKVDPYSINCQSCVVTNELRRRGFNVTALPNMLNDSTNAFDLSVHPNLIWRNPITGTAPDIIPCDTARYMNLGSQCAEGERYHLMLQSNGSGHIVEFERINGEICILDPQNGKHYDVEGYFNQKTEDGHTYISQIRKMSFYRVDNCEIFGDYANGIVTKASKDA